MNAAGLALLREFEGFRERAYLCPAGVPTVGYGFTHGVELGDTITRAEADARLAVEVAEFEGGVLTACTRFPTPNQLAALVCLAFNIGLGAFKRSTVLRRHNAGETFAAAQAFLLWTRGGGVVLPGLVRRREAERALYLRKD